MAETKVLANLTGSEIDDILPVAMVKFDRKGNVISMNKASEELLGAMNLPPADFIGTLPHRHKSLLRLVTREHRSEEMDWAYGNRKLHLIFKSSEDGAYLFMFDLTAQEEAKAQLIQNEKMASLGLLIAGLAHEINTPLGAIHSNNDTISRSVDKICEILQEQDFATPEKRRQQQKLAGIVKDLCENTSLATDRLISIVSSLKNFARLDEAELKKADIHEGIESTLTIAQHQLKNRIQVVKEYGQIPLLECHPNRLNQVFMNLIINAAQAIPDRGTITIKTERQGDQLRISFSDTGVGIPPENIPRIFDPGFTTKGVGVGTGLGLSICYKIIEEHQGKIDVASSDKGTTFTIILPIGHKRKVKRG